MSMGREEERNSSEEAVGSQESGIGSLAGILQGIQRTLADLSEASKSQSEAFQTLHEDLILQSDPDNDGEQNTGDDITVDPTSVVQDLLDTSQSKENGAILDGEQRSDTEPQNNFLDSLTQAFIASERNSPAIEPKIASLVDSILSGKLSSETAKERGEKYFPPENCERVCTPTVNEEIWDLLPRRSRTVDLAFQRVQDTLIQGLSSLALLADRLVKEVQGNKSQNMMEVLHHAMDSLVLLSQTNWNLNLKRRELIKPDLNPPFTRLCKPDIPPTTKLFGDDLSKHLKEMTDVCKVGKQLQKKPPQQKPHYQKPYDRPRGSFNHRGYNKKPFLGHGRAAHQSPLLQKKSHRKDN